MKTILYLTIFAVLTLGGPTSLAKESDLVLSLAFKDPAKQSNTVRVTITNRQ